MARGRNPNDPREVFHIDRMRFINRQTDPSIAPERNTCEIYIKNDRLFKIRDDGVISAINATGVSASPGFTWGRQGRQDGANKPFLLNNEVPSNIAGRAIFFTSPTIRKVFIARGVTPGGTPFPATTFEVLEHDGTIFTSLLTISLTAGQRDKEQDFTVSVTSGKELAVKVNSGLCNNPVVGVILDGLF